MAGRQTGSILLVVLVFLLVLGQMVMSAVERAQLARRLQFNFSDRGLAFHSAESALVFAEQQFFDVLTVQGLLQAASRWSVADDSSISCHVSQQAGGSGFNENMTGESLSGFAALADAPRYRVQTVWPFSSDVLSDKNGTLESGDQQAQCGVLYLAQSCGFGRYTQTVVRLQLQVYACCNQPDGCGYGGFYGYERSLLELH